MTTFQKVIKSLAIALAIALTIGIISGIMSGLYSLGKILGNSLKEDANQDYYVTEVNQSMMELDIDLNNTNLVIMRGDKLYFKTNNKNIIYSEKNEKLKISENSNWSFDYAYQELIIYVPENFEFENIKIKNGIGTTKIEELNSKNINFDFGAGQVNINNIKVMTKTNISTGAGAFKIENAILNNLKFDMGVGKTTIQGNIIGTSELNTGIGEVNISLTNRISEYQLKVNKGIGNITIDNKTVIDNETIGEGPNYIDLSGGIGSISINFENN